MNQMTNPDAKTFTGQIAEWTDENLLNCFGADECMKVCPAGPGDISIADLNEATRDTAPLQGAILKFTADCVQCANCDTACPAAAGRSVMMLALKEKMAAQGFSPKTHERYFALKGHDKSLWRRAVWNALVKVKWALDPRDALKRSQLSPHVGKKGLRHAEHLVYLGCYIFTKTSSAAQAVDVAERLGLDYEVIGGLDSCCGWPSLIAGRTAEAEDYHAHLAGMVGQVSPRYAVTGCAECFMSLRAIKEKYKMDFEPLTVPMWLNMFADRLRLSKTAEKVTFHDSCHVSRKAGLPKPARDLIARMADIVEMPRSGSADAFCCGYWGLGNDPAMEKSIHLDRFGEAEKTGAATMVVECVTCMESFSKHASLAGVRIRDALDMVHERMTGP
jgi:Fe-S oxidoreductase